MFNFKKIDKRIGYKLSKEKPPVYKKCNELFGASWDDGVIFTYGNTIHCKFEVPDIKLEHEKTHVKQQIEYGKRRWWKRYYKDDEFRLDQELEAYRSEYKFAKKVIKDRNMLNKYLYNIAGI